MEKGKGKEPESSQRPASESPGNQARVNGKTSTARTASKEQFKKAHRKTSNQHAGLFRRLAE